MTGDTDNISHGDSNAAENDCAKDNKFGVHTDAKADAHQPATDTECGHRMMANTRFQAQPTPIASGGALTSLDMSSEKDRGMVRQAMKRRPKRWRGLADEVKDEFLEGLLGAHRKAVSVMQGAEDESVALKAVGEVGSIVRTAVMMEGQHQADEHLDEKNGRLDSGQITDAVRVVRVAFDEGG